MSIPVLRLKDYGVSNGDKTILESITLDVPEKGIFNILGPMSAGKSTLIRTLSGVNDSNSKIKSWGKASYLGAPIGEAGLPAMVMQSAKLMMSSVLENILTSIPGRKDLNRAEQCELACNLLKNANLDDLVDCLDMSTVDLPLETMRHLAIVRVCAANPALIFIDDPTIGIEYENANKILNYIKTESEKRAVAIVSHNKEQARLLGGRAVLMADGKIWENASTEELLLSPKSIIAKEFIENGSCSDQMLNEELSEKNIKDSINQSSLPIEINIKNNDVPHPEGFIWLKEGKIAGMRQPGIAEDVEQDLEALQKIGITHLISLTSDIDPIDPEILAKYSISSIYEPIDDFGVPTVEQASFICEEIGHLMSQGKILAIHCKSGIGRTGVMLASHLIWEGQSVAQALEFVRNREPGWVQSEEQIHFIEEFAIETAGESDFAIAAGERV